MKKNRLLGALLALCLLFAAVGCAGGTAEEGGPQPETPGTAEEPVYAEVSGQVFEGEDFVTCGILCVEEETQEEQFYLTDYAGRFGFSLEKGNYTLTFYKDSQYQPYTVRLQIKNQLPQRFPSIQLERLFDLREKGYYSADLHQHSVYSDGKDSPYDMYRYDLAMNLGVAALTDHNSVGGTSEFLKTGALYEDTLAVSGVEVTSADKGHINVLNTDTAYGYAFESKEDVIAMIEEAKSDTTFVQINHPARLDVMGFDYLEELPDFGFDGYELWNGKAESPMSGTNLAAKNKWFEYLSAGYYIPATAGSDNHGYETQHSKNPRTYVRMESVTTEAFLAALKSGHSFLSNGPVVLADINGTSYGDAVAPGAYTLRTEVLYNAAVGTVRVIVNGEVFSKSESGENSCTSETELTLKAGDYVVIETESPDGGYAITNPIFCK